MFFDVFGVFDVYWENLVCLCVGDFDGDVFRMFFGIYVVILCDVFDIMYIVRVEFLCVGDNGLWSSVDMLFFGLNLLKELMLFFVWDECIEVELVIVYFGIFVCDLMLDV